MSVEPEHFFSFSPSWKFPFFPEPFFFFFFLPLDHQPLPNSVPSFSGHLHRRTITSWWQQRSLPLGDSSSLLLCVFLSVPCELLSCCPSPATLPRHRKLRRRPPSLAKQLIFSPSLLPFLSLLLAGLTSAPITLIVPSVLLAAWWSIWGGGCWVEWTTFSSC